MAHRTVLTERQYALLLRLPSEESVMLQHYVLSDDDIKHIYRKRKPSNKLGFAIQLCALRFPGRYISPAEIIPKEMIHFIAVQLGIDDEAIEEYAVRNPTRYDHLASLKAIYGFRAFEHSQTITSWLLDIAQYAKNNYQLAELLIEKCRTEKIIVPAISTIGRVCSDALISAEQRITEQIVSRLDHRMRQHLYTMLDETVDGRLTVHGWLKRFELGHNSADINRLLDKLEYLQELDIPDHILENVPTHRVIWLRQQGEAYYADGLRDINETRRLAILAVCAIEWKAMIVDTVLETHDRIVGKLYSTCQRMRDDQSTNHRKITNDTLKSFMTLGKKLLRGHKNNKAIQNIFDDTNELEALVNTATMLTKKLSSDPLEFVLTGYGRFRRYTQRMLEDIDFEGNHAAQPLLDAITLLKTLNEQSVDTHDVLPISFANAKWKKRLGSKPEHKLWETAVLFAIRDGLRSRDICVHDSRSYNDTRSQLLTTAQAKQCLSLPISLNPNDWVDSRKAMLAHELKQVSRMIQNKSLPNSTIENGKIRVKRLEKNVTDGIDALTIDLYKQMPQVSITEILREVNEDTGFTEAFTHLYTGSPCPDTIGLLNVLLAEGINLGLKKMAACSSSHTSFWTLMRISSWHVTCEASKEALAIIVDAQRNLPLSPVWGDGTTSSSDGQFMYTGGTGEAMNLVNAKAGKRPSIKLYTHLSDQYAAYALQTIPSTVFEAPYILNGLTMNDTGKRIKEHYADTGGFTDHVFAMCALLGYEFAPRLRNLPTLCLYGMKDVNVPKAMRELITANANLSRIEQQWPDIIRLVASIITHKVIPSDMLRQLASFPRQNDLAIALREIGRIERSVFILKWIRSTALQRRTQMGLNKGEAHHALKRALNFNRRGEITDRFSENQHLRMMNLNLLTAIIIYWNTKHLGRIIRDRKQQGQDIPPDKLAHLSPLGWEHIILTGFYKW